MDDNYLLRFNRQILLPQVDIKGQQKLDQSQVTVIGLGGLGCPVATYLAAAGVGRLILIDHDVVELTNLQRQLAYTQADIDSPKTETIRQLCADINPHCKITAIQRQFDLQAHQNLIQSSDVIVDATDNIESRRAINAASVLESRPLVFAAAIRMEGQLTVFDPRDNNSPCYECVFGHVNVNETCSEGGILGTVVGTLGLMQATEAIKLIVGMGQSPVGRLLLYDALSCDWQSIKIRRRGDCPVCSKTISRKQD